MMIPKSPPRVPPTMKNCCRSLWHSFWLGAGVEVGVAVEVAEKGDPVDTAVATAEPGLTLAATADAATLKAPIESMLSRGAVALSQQLAESPSARQQYVPISHIWRFQDFVEGNPLKFLFPAML